MLFRPEALRKLSSPEDLKGAIRVTSPMTWLLILVLVFCFGLLSVWSVAGTIHTRVIGPAFIEYENAQLTEVIARGNGTLVHLNVSQGDVVRAGSALGSVSNPSLAGRLEQARRLADEALETINAYQATRDAELSEFDRLQALRRAAMESRLEQATEMADAYEIRLANSEELFQQGITSVAAVNELRSQFFLARQEMEAARNDIAQLALDREERTSQWNRLVLEQRTRHSELVAQVRELEADLEQTETIQSPVDGEVSPILVTPGEHLDAGETVFTIVSLNAHLDTLAFLSTDDAKLVEPGMSVRISPATVRQEEYGTIIGEVVEVSSFPMSTEALLAILHNRDLVGQFTQSGAPIMVRVAMEQDQNGDLVWTSGEVPPIDVTAGTLATISVIVREQAPITLLLPTLRTWTGLQ